MTSPGRIVRCLIIAAGALPWAANTSNAAVADDQEAFFESHIRPLLVDNCLRCHGAEKQEGGLRLDSREAILAGGDRGAAMTPGEPADSVIIEAINYSPDLQMPPDRQLDAAQIDALTRWIELGAYWPESAARITSPAEEHWAFQPVRAVEPPDVNGDFWVQSPIDAFVLAKLQEADLRPTVPADRRTLIRRAYYALTGLPPSQEEVERFVNDADPGAYERLIDELLASSHYGEQWARHWLDVARYSDTKGYVYAREERFWVHAWTYRDWVVNALNDDMPYDRFLLLQIAADQVADRRESDLAAMGFLTIGRRFLGIERDIVDDRIDVVCRGTMGLTVACARCHDHKYDPIPTADYYSLYGVFDSSREQLVPIDPGSHGDEAFRAELAKRQQAHADAMQANRLAASTRARGRVADYLLAQLELHKFPAQGFDQLLDATILIPDFVRHWQTYLQEAERNHDPLWIPWHAYRALPADQFAALASDVTAQLQTQAEAINPLVLEAFATPPASMVDVAQRYGVLLREIDVRWQEQLLLAGDAVGVEPPTRFDNPAEEQLRRVLYGPGAPCEVPDEPLVHSEYFFDTDIVNSLWGTQGEVDRWIINAPFDAPYALMLEDREQPSHPYIFLRGNPQNLGDEVPRQFLSLLSGPARRPFQHGSGRYELAQAIIDPANPLTARVIVNRIWAHHFGVGLVDTPSDFGTRAETPSHPELLDWLATRFIAHGWSQKWLHREIMLSSVYQQASAGTEESVLAHALQVDPDNRLLWRMNPRRLSFEEIRDAMLAAGGDLDLTPGGRPAEIFTPPYPVRRTLYGRVDRQFLPSTLRMFDFANPDLHIPQRSETTVPQQALFLMNNPLVLERARVLADLVPEDAADDAAIRTLFQRVYQREPTDQQLAGAIEFLQTTEESESITPPATAADWQYGYGPLDETAGRVSAFTPLPHFSGSAWQEEGWPNGSLGWVQLTAEGGHPGNDRDHAAIRRWTAPRAMTVAITSQFEHEPDVSDGVRVFIISSRAGVLTSATILHGEQELDVPTLAVEPGETIDFLVDIGGELNSDQFLWEAALTEQAIETAVASQPLTTWNSRSDFPVTTTHQLTPLEQLAQLLLCSNEFVFVD